MSGIEFSTIGTNSIPMNNIVRLRPAIIALKRFLFSRSLRSAAFAFMLTRAIVFITFALTTHYSLRESPTPNSPKEPYISLHAASVAQALRGLALVNDAGWYFGIVQSGYEKRLFEASAQHNWAFFPLHPLLWRYAAKLTGKVALTGIVLANTFFFFALILLHKICAEFEYDEATADRAVFYAAAFPTSYFFSLPWTESLFFLLVIGSFYLAKRRAWWLACLLGALASATRATGIILVPALFVLYLQSRPRPSRAHFLGLLLIPLGLGAFMLHLYNLTGNALAFKDVLIAWGRKPGFFAAPFLDYISDPGQVGIPWNFKPLNVAAAFLALGCGLTLLKKRSWALGVFALASVLMPLSTNNSMSLARYVMVIFPIYMVLGASGRSSRIDQTIRAVFIVLLGLMSALFAANITLAGA